LLLADEFKLFYPMNQIILENRLSLRYKSFGKGSEYLFCFHGYMLPLSLFDTLEPIWGKKYTVVVLSIPGQNGSEVFNQDYFEHSIQNEDWKAIFEAIKQHFNVTSYHIAAFSLGSRIAFKWIELFPKEIKSVQLFSPDGFYIAKTFWFANKTLLGRGIVKVNVQLGDVFLLFIKVLSIIGLVPHKYYAFVEGNYKGKAKRQQLYETWNLLRACIFPRKNMLRLIDNLGDIPFNIYIGKHDTILPLSYFKAFRNHPKLHFKELPKAHMLLRNPNIIDFIT
jgi:pimeloyl-ACP methyl ester carboxylesterase